MRLLIAIFFSAISLIGTAKDKQEKSKPNVLFIVVDDLKPVLGCYGDENVKTPGIDALASQGVIFDYAYCQQAVCAPSRISCFTGMRPDRTQVVDLKTNMRDKNPNIVTMPQFFKQNGYETAGLGKLMHGAKNNDPSSWTVPYKEKNDLDYADGYEYPANGKYQNPEAIKAYKEAKAKRLSWKETNNYLKERNLSPATESADVPDNAYPDGAVAEAANKLLERFAENDKPFFLAVGLNRPHLPFSAPKKYWDMYDRNSIEVHPFQEQAKNSPAFAYHTWGELRNYSDIPDKGDLSDDKQKELIHGYWASTSFADAQVGKVINKLKELNLDENTIVVLWGDHGWHLGDHGMWCKHSNFEQATKVPFIISAPGMSQGERASTMTEMVDIFPTLAEYASLPVPEKLEGESLIPVLKKPKTKIKDYAISQFPRGNNNMGYTMRTDRYRITLWLKGDFMNSDITKEPVILATELYDYKKDPLEKESLAGRAEYRETITKLRNKLIALLQEQAKTNKVNYGKKQQVNKNKKPGTSSNMVAGVLNIDGSFSKSLDAAWTTKAANGALVDFKINKSGNGNMLNANVKSLGKNPWDIQLMSKKLSRLEAGNTLLLNIKGKGGEVKITLHPKEGKQIIRKIILGEETKEQHLKFPVTASGDYRFKILFTNEGEYQINEIKVLNGGTNEGAKTIPVKPAKGTVNLDNPNIHVFGANYVTRSIDGLSFSRFSEEAYTAPNEERMFSVANGKTLSGVKFQFKTKSKKLTLKFMPSEGANRGAEFQVLQDSEFFNNYKFDRTQSQEEMVLTISNKNPGKSTVFEVVMPSWCNVKLNQMILDEDVKIEEYKPEKKPVYFAMGNSITHGVGQGSASYLTYPYLLAQKLKVNYYNLAVGGAKISPAVAEQTAEMPQANLITILIGYNDLVGYGKTPEQYVKDYRMFLTTVRKNHPKAAIYCISVTHTKTTKSKKTDYTPDDFRLALKELIGEFSATDNKIVFVAGEEITTVENLDETRPQDPVHFGVKGAALFADELYKIISKDFKASDVAKETKANEKPIRQIVEQNYPENTLYIGATSTYNAMGTPESKILAREFSYTTPANDFKQSYIHPKPDVWQWEKPDAWIKFAKKHNQVLRIHGPISPQCSRWTRNDERTAEELSKNLEEYMTALCKRYNNEEVAVWMDVINETVSRDGTWKKAKEGDNGWEMPWEAMGYVEVDKDKYPHLGGEVPKYIIQAFEIATREATNKKLIINQHGSMSPELWNKIKDLVYYLRDQGYRVDGIGWQAHISYGRDVEWESPEVSIKALKDLIAWTHKNNLEFHVTECNIHVPVNDPGTEAEHIKTYMNIFNALLEMSEGGVIGFNLWNIKDVPHYKNKKKKVIAPWDANLEPKAIYYKLKQSLENPPEVVN